jgi:hypothetical protein
MFHGILRGSRISARFRAAKVFRYAAATVSVQGCHTSSFSSVAMARGRAAGLLAMNSSSRPIWLICLTLGACAGSAQPAAHADSQVGEASGSAPQASELPPAATGLGSVSAASQNPYAPRRVGPLHQYAWQNPKQPPCSRAQLASLEQKPTYTTQVKLSFFGSVAAFPLTADDDSGVLPPKPEADGAPVEPQNARRDPDFVVASLRPRLRSCFSSLLERSEQAEGSIRFALSLGCAGEVQTISAKTEGVDEPTIECLFAVVAPAMFDPPAGGHATIQVPVVFKNSAR